MEGGARPVEDGAPATDRLKGSGMSKNLLLDCFMNREKRLRSGWRILIQFLAWFILLIIVQILQGVALFRGDAMMFSAGAGLYILGGLAVAWALGRWLDRRRFAEFGFHLDRAWWLDLGAGLVLGAASFSAVFLVQWAAGWIEITSVAQSQFEGTFAGAAASILLAMVAVGINEELVFRGYQIRNLVEGLLLRAGSRKGLVAALLITSAFFGVMHLPNPNVSLPGWANVVLAGLLLGWAYVLTGQLALPIGVHITWNFCELFVYGFATSGLPSMGWLLGSELNGPGLWTGGAFGPEAGLVVTVLLLVDGLLISAWVKLSGRWKGVRAELAEYRCPGLVETAT